MAREHQPVVVDVGGLGQAGGTGGVDIERAVLDAERPSLARRQRVARQGTDRAVDAREIAGARTMQPDAGVGGEVRLRARERRPQLDSHDDVPGLDDVDAVGERVAGEVGVEQRHYSSDSRHAEPDRHVFRPVRHQQADRVALADAVLERPARVAVGARSKLAIGQSLTVREQRRRIVELLGELLDHDRQDTVGMLDDRLDLLERAQRALQARHVALDPLDQPHWRSCPPRSAP
jgi:hypothetical protein